MLWSHSWALALPIAAIAAAVQSGAMGLRLALTVDEDGAPLLRLIRHGPTVDGLSAGALLVATHVIGGGIFHRSVLLITRHAPGTGTVGYILNVPLALEPIAALEGDVLRHALAVNDVDGAVWYGVGGPVALSDWEVLHGFAAVYGAVEVAPGCFVGGQLPLLQDAARAAARELVARGRPRLHAPLVQAVFGHAAWAPGQLEGEIRAGAWKWAAGLGARFVRDPDVDTMWARALAAVEAAHEAAAAAVPP